MPKDLPGQGTFLQWSLPKDRERDLGVWFMELWDILVDAFWRRIGVQPEPLVDWRKSIGRGVDLHDHSIMKLLCSAFEVFHVAWRAGACIRHEGMQ